MPASHSLGRPGEGSPPSFEQVADYVAYTATGKTLERATGEDGFVGHAAGYRLHLIYRPDPVWMRGEEAKLDLTAAERIAAAIESSWANVPATASALSCEAS